MRSTGKFDSNKGGIGRASQEAGWLDGEAIVLTDQFEVAGTVFESWERWW